MAKKLILTSKHVTNQPNSGIGRKNKVLQPTQDEVGASLRIVDRLINMGMPVSQIPPNHIEALQNAIKHEITPTGYESFEAFTQKVKALGIVAIISSDE